MKIPLLTIGAVLAASQAMAQDLDGKALYEKNCRRCHGVDGTPSAAILKMQPSLPKLTAEFMASRSNDSVVAVLTNGTPDGKKKPLKDKMTAEEMAAVATYVREMVKKEGAP